MTFLFKLHGSCYESASCIDTRLQRAQGLPSHLTDILDTLLQRSVWFVAGFSGSDMNDNLDYLRLISNKQHARVVWLSYSANRMEVALRGLLKTMDWNEILQDMDLRDQESQVRQVSFWK